MLKATDFWKWMREMPKWRWAAALVVLVLLGWAIWGGGSKGQTTAPTFTARRGPLEINILEGGSLQALESQEIKCEVRVGYQGSKILRIVEEGYLVTDDDVRTNKVLVELDSSDLEKQIVQQEIQYQSAYASLIDAQQNYEIQLNQNQSDIKAAEQKTRFARMDFDKFLGDSVTVKIIQEVGLDKLLASASTNDVEQTLRAEEAFDQGQPKEKAPNVRPQVPVPGTNLTAVQGIQSAVLTRPSGVKGPTPIQAEVKGEAEGIVRAPARPSSGGPEDEDAGGALDAALTNAVMVDFSKYARLDVLGDGEAKQKVRKFDDDLQVAQKEMGQANSTLEGTKRLFEKGFVTRLDLQRDEITAENSRLKVQTAESARDLFLKYDFLKSAEESLSKYAESVRELDKARRVAISKAAQAKARLKSAQGQHEVQLRQRNELKEQLTKCTLRAAKTGLVVYGGGRDDYFGGEERIREGATVRERQAIITIPDMSRMAVNVKIHESYIKKVVKGQKARITVDAFPDKTLIGEVTKVGVLPDSQNRWMNPDLKVYQTMIAIEGSHDWVKPGMSAKVEILVSRIDDCVYVPVQSVEFDSQKQYCYLANGLKSDRRQVTIGDYNDEFIEIKSGVKEGDRVLLRLPASSESQKGTAEGAAPEKSPKTEPAKAPAGPAPGAATVAAKPQKT
jgi:multidrug resistance efflux pump